MYEDNNIKTVGITQGEGASVMPPQMTQSFSRVAGGPQNKLDDPAAQVPRANVGQDPAAEHMGPEGAGSYGQKIPSELKKFAPSENLPEPTKNNLKILNILLSKTQMQGAKGPSIG